jgi:hypothetical protein
MDSSHALVPIVLFITMFATLFAFLYLRNKEHMALIERGINPKESYKKFGSLTYLKYGLLMIGCGLGLIVAYMMDLSLPPVQSPRDPDRPALYFSLIGICGGIGLVISYFIEKKEMQKHSNKE